MKLTISIIISLIIACFYLPIKHNRSLFIGIFFLGILLTILLRKYIIQNNSPFRYKKGVIYLTIAYLSYWLMMSINRFYLKGLGNYQEYQLYYNLDELNSHIQAIKEKNIEKIKYINNFIDIFIWSSFKGIGGYFILNNIFLSVPILLEMLLDFVETSIYVYWIESGQADSKIFIYWRYCNIIKHCLYWITITYLIYRIIYFITK